METIIKLPVIVQTGIADSARIVDADGFTIAQAMHDYRRAESNKAMGDRIAGAINSHTALIDALALAYAHIGTLAQPDNENDREERAAVMREIISALRCAGADMDTPAIVEQQGNHDA